MTEPDADGRRVADALREQTSLLESAERLAHMGSWSMDLESGRLRWSDGTCALFGIAPGEFRGTFEHFESFLLPADRDALAAAHAEALAETEVIQAEYRIRRADGAVRWMYERGVVERDEAGRPVRRLGMVMDVTETDPRAAREALALSEERFRLVARVTHDVIWDWDLAGDRVWWSEGAAALLGGGSDAHEISHRSWSERVHPDDFARVSAGIRAVLEGAASSWSDEYRLLRADGTTRYVLDRAHVLRDPGGRALRMIGGISDRTEQQRAAERLREQATLLDKARDAILVRSLDHRILYWNQSAERLYGHPASEAIGRSIVELLYDDPGRYHLATQATLTHGEWSGEIEHLTRAGRRLVVEGRWTLVRDDAGEPRSILAINTDITDRKKLEEQFLRAQRMESVGTLAGGIAHDLNNVLTPILMSIAMLQEDETDPARLEDLATLETSAQRGAAMVQQLLAFARGDSARRTGVDLGKIAREVRRMLRETFPKDVSFRVEVDPELWEVPADPTQMHQVLTNLCVNARDAMPNGGALTVTVERVVLDEVYAQMNLEARPGPYVLVRVEDTGEGIPPPVLDRIFEPFFTTKEVGRGTGLGLSTVHAIVRSHQGFVHVYSEVGVGTRFKVYLPADVPEERSELHARELSSLPRGRGELVLVVDDEEAIRHVAERTLTRFGYRVTLASNGAEAVALYAKSQGAIAVVLTDMAMPVMDGPATIVALKALDPEVRIVGSSGLNANGNVAKALGAGVKHFVPKPYTAEALLRVLHEVLSSP